MMGQAEDIISGEFDAADAVINHDVAEVLRSQPDDPVVATFAVEEIISEITKSVDRRLESICGQNIELMSSEMSVFSKASLYGLDETKTLTLCIHGEEEKLVSCVVFNRSFAQRLIRTTFTGAEQTGNEESEGNLHLAERAILQVFTDQIMLACFEVVDSLADYGFPGKPQFADMKQMTKIVEKHELVRVSFIVGEENPRSEFQLLMPLALFDNTNPDSQDHLDRRKASEEERLWTSRLLDQIEILEIPLTIELACADLPLAYVDSLKVGSQLELDIDPKNMILRDAEGHGVFMADLELGKIHFQLNVRGLDSAEGA